MTRKVKVLLISMLAIGVLIVVSACVPIGRPLPLEKQTGVVCQMIYRPVHTEFLPVTRGSGVNLKEYDSVWLISVQDSQTGKVAELSVSEKDFERYKIGDTYTLEK